MINVKTLLSISVVVFLFFKQLKMLHQNQWQFSCHLIGCKVKPILSQCIHTGKCIRRFGGIYAYLCKHLGMDSSSDHPDRYSNLYLNAYINRHVHAKYLKMI